MTYMIVETNRRGWFVLASGTTAASVSAALVKAQRAGKTVAMITGRV